MGVCQIQGTSFRVRVSRCKVQGARFRVRGSKCEVEGIRVQYEYFGGEFFILVWLFLRVYRSLHTVDIVLRQWLLKEGMIHGSGC
jgi:hypothetical protein